MAVTINLTDSTAIADFNSPNSGILQKSNAKSIFLILQKNSGLENSLFPSDCSGSKITNNGEVIEVVILQVTSFGDRNIMVEIIRKSDLQTSETENI